MKAEETQPTKSKNTDIYSKMKKKSSRKLESAFDSP